MGVDHNNIGAHLPTSSSNGASLTIKHIRPLVLGELIVAASP